VNLSIFLELFGNSLTVRPGIDFGSPSRGEEEPPGWRFAVVPIRIWIVLSIFSPALIHENTHVRARDSRPSRRKTAGGKCGQIRARRRAMRSENSWTFGGVGSAH